MRGDTNFKQVDLLSIPYSVVISSETPNRISGNKIFALTLLSFQSAETPTGALQPPP